MAFALVIALASHAAGQSATVAAPPADLSTTAEDTGSGTQPPTAPAGFARAVRDWLHGETLTGDWLGWRQRLVNAGVTPTITYTAAILGNPAGGINHKVRYFHDIFAGLVFDLDRLVAIPGAQLQVSMSSRAGNSLSDEDIGNVFDVAQVCCQPHTRLVTLAWQQSLFDDRLNVRVGRMSVGDDFAASPLYLPFVTSGIDANPGAIAINVPFSEYPDASLGLRVRARPRPEVKLQLGLYDGDPDGTRTGGEDFDLSFDDGVLVAAEAEYELRWGEGPAALPGHYGIGGYYHSGTFLRFAQQFDSNSMTGLEHGNGGIYAMADQQLLYFGPPEAGRGVTPFVAVVGAPATEINPFPFFFDAGVVVQGPFDARPDDALLFGIVYGSFSSALRQAQRAAGVALQDFEMVFEWSYAIQVTPWFEFEPNVQYVVRPGGTGDIPNAVVVGAQIELEL
jgi:porin